MNRTELFSELEYCLPSKVQCFQHNDRPQSTTSHFHWKLNAACCSLHQTGQLRLMQKQQTMLYQLVLDFI